MSEEVKKRLDEYCKKQEELLRKRRNVNKEKELIERGLYDVLESSDWQKGYHYSESHKKFIKKIPLDVTDEDFERIMKYKIKTKGDYLVLLGTLILILGPIFGLLYLDSPHLMIYLILASSFFFSVIFFNLYNIVKKIF